MDDSLHMEKLDRGDKSWASVIADSLHAVMEASDIKNRPSTKRGFRQFLGVDKEIVEEALWAGIQLLQERVNGFIPDYIEDFLPSEERGHFKKALGFSLDRAIANLSGRNLEVSLERTISASTNSTVGNHFALLSGIHRNKNICKNVAIDLIMDRGNQALTLIELKGWKNDGNSPIHSLFEIASYCYCYEKMLTLDSRFKQCKDYSLVVMAPKVYFDYWGISPEVLDTLAGTVHHLLSKHVMGINKLEFVILDVAQSRFLEQVAQLGENFSSLDNEFKNELNWSFLHALGVN